MGELHQWRRQGRRNRVQANIATPNPTAAFQYTRVAVFGFDTSEVDLTDVQSVVFSAAMTDDVIQAYAGATLRFHLVANSLPDQFDETNLTDPKTPGLTVGNLGSGIRSRAQLLER